jgi:hypothetical protein
MQELGLRDDWIMQGLGLRDENWVMQGLELNNDWGFVRTGCKKQTGGF